MKRCSYSSSLHMKVKRRLTLLLVIFLFCIGASGCWDRVEIDERAFVLGVAIDLVPPSESHIEPIPGQVPIRDNIYDMTVEIPIVSQMAGAEGGSSEKEPNWVISSTGADITEISRTIMHRANRFLFYGHQKVLVIGEELAKEGIKPIIDFFDREPETNKRVKLIIAERDAKETLKITPKLSSAASLYIFEILEHEHRSSRLIDSNIGRALVSLRESGNALLARVRASEEEVVVGGSAIIKDWKLVGWLGEIETRAAMFVMGEVRGGIITIQDPRAEGGKISLEISSVKRIITPYVEGDDVTFNIEVLIEGDITENTGPNLTVSRETVEIAQERIGVLVKEDIKSIISKVQQEFKADFFLFSHLLAARRPHDWKRLESRWNEIFLKVKLNIDVRVRVRRFGVVR